MQPSDPTRPATGRTHCTWRQVTTEGMLPSRVAFTVPTLFAMLQPVTTSVPTPAAVIDTKVLSPASALQNEA